MSFIWRLSPANLPPIALQKGGLHAQRERVIQVLLIIFCSLGLPSTVLGVLGAISEGKTTLIFVYTGVYLLFLGMLFARDLPYAIRASLMASVAYLLALAELFESGQLGEVRMFLIAFVALVAVLFNYQMVIGAIGLGLLTVLSVGIGSTILPPSLMPFLSQINQGTDWVTSLVVYLMLATMIGGSVSIIIRRLEKNLDNQALLAQKLDAERSSLDFHIQERTQQMNHRLIQLRTAADISRSISALNDQDVLLGQVVELLKDRFYLYYAGVFLIDENRQFAVLKAGTGEAGRKMIADGHHLAVGGSSMIGWSVANRMARIALDVGTEAVRFNNPRLPLTRSEMALPIIAHDEVFGALTIQSEKPNAFDQDDITILEGVAGSLAIALENARLYQEARQNLDEIRALNRDYLHRAWAETSQINGDLNYEYESSFYLHGQSTHSYQAPLALRGETIGEISLEMGQPEISEEDRSLIENIMTQTAVALENARLLQETERKAVQEQKLNQISSRFSHAVRVDDILRTVVQELGKLPTVAEVSVHLSSPDHEPDVRIVPAQDQKVNKNGNGKEHLV